MSAEHAQREPTMEEILASIRRIISEEDKPAEGGGDVLDLQPPAPPVIETKAPPPKPEPMPVPAVAKAPAPPVFQEPAPAVDHELIIVDYEEEPAPPPVAAAPKPAPQPEWKPPVRDTLVSEPVATQTASQLDKLMGSMFVSSGNTLDDVVRALLKPMLKEWLDANLPQIVEAEVEKEIDRIRRMAR